MTQQITAHVIEEWMDDDRDMNLSVLQNAIMWTKFPLSQSVESMHRDGHVTVFWTEKSA